MGFGKDGKGAIITESRSVSIGTLAPSTGLLIGTKLATTKDYRMLKSEIVCTIVGASALELAGMSLYLVPGQYTLVEFEAGLESQGPLDPNDSPAEELSMRPYWFAGATPESTHTGQTAIMLLNSQGGTLLVVKPRWTFLEAKSWNWILYNHGEAPTTGATVRIKCRNYGVWIR